MIGPLLSHMHAVGAQKAQADQMRAEAQSYERDLLDRIEAIELAHSPLEREDVGKVERVQGRWRCVVDGESRIPKVKR